LPTSIANATLQELVQVFPNPSNTGKFNFYGNNTITHLEVFDMLGKKVFESNYQDASVNTIDLSNQQSGVYILRIAVNNGSSLTHKLVKQ
jgi:hypothetical protein